MWVSDPCRFLLFIAISINTGLPTAGFTQCCVSCKPKRFYLYYGLEVASASSKVKIEMKESSIRAMVTLPQGRLFSWENTVVALAEDKAFSAISVFDAQRIFFPMFLCVHVHETYMLLCTMTGTDGSCVITEHTSCICPAMCFQAQSHSFGLVLPLGATQS